MTTTHIRKMKCGITCTMLHNGATGNFDCIWSLPPPWGKEQQEQILAEYEPWRDGIIGAWAGRLKRTAVVVKIV